MSIHLMMMNYFIDDVNLDESTSLEHLFNSLDRHHKDNYGLNSQHSVYYNVKDYTDLPMQYEDGFRIAYC